MKGWKWFGTEQEMNDWIETQKEYNDYFLLDHKYFACLYDDGYLDERIDDLDLNPRIFAALKFYRIEYISDLTFMSEEEVLKLRFMRKGDINEVKERLEERGFSLRKSIKDIHN